MRYFSYFFLLLILFSCSENEKKQLSIKKGDEFYSKGESLFNKNSDSAYYYFNKSFEYYQKENDNINSSNALIYQSFIQNEKGDYFGSVETCIEALKILGKKQNNLISIYNSIAISKTNLKDHKDAIIWYEKALDITDNLNERAHIINNLSTSLYEEKKFKRAISLLESIKIENPEIHKNLKSKIIDNLAYAKFLQDSTYNALPMLLNALKMREKENDIYGISASNSHLSNYFFKKDKSQSLFYAKEMLLNTKKINNPDDKLEALEKLILLETPDNSKKYFHDYQMLSDSIQTVRAKSKNQFALIRYDTEKEKSENIKKQNHILKQYIVIAILFISLCIGFIWYKRRKKRLQQQKELEVKNTQIKYSKKVHDVVANGLYHTMMQIQNNPDFDKERTLNDIERMYEESRDIAREDLEELQDKDFSKRLAEMLNSYSSDKHKILIVGNNQQKWNNISNNIQMEVFYTLRECMINMIKHSKAKLVSIKIEKTEKFLKIKYTDNGVGMDFLQKKSTSGIRNMENRIATINGKIIFEKNMTKGLVIHITIPT
ncbi:hypothetical protein [Chishuiella sp.]|uniref:tetratricopeptide repeat-containing sensor histidine kinase n=1 Tax=Chishuiella sp. TaxID=1969467 RepID=UPI0028AD2CC1|nr:hypothetical protein [Chishuiella sp.]